MNEKQVIKKLSQLHSLQPEKKLLQAMKVGVYRRFDFEDNGYILNKNFLRKFFVYLHSEFYEKVVFLGVLLLLISSFAFFPNQLHTAILSSRLALAPNQYIKARITLSDTITRYNSTKAVDNHSIHDISYALAFTNIEMVSLKIKGESKKYTAKECHELYQQYLTYLNNEYSTVSNSHDPLTISLQTQIHSYQEQAEKKLHMYYSM